MRMQHYRIKDVPLKKRPGYVWTYYKWHIILAAIGIFMVSGLIYTIFIRPRTDVSVMWLSPYYELSADTLIKERLAGLPWDVNGDGKVSVGVQHVEFTDNPEKNLDVQMQMMTLIGSGSFDIYLVSDTALAWFLEKDLAGSWTDYDADSEKGDEPFIIPCKELAFFRGDGLSSMEELTLVIAKPSEDEKKAEFYRREMDALKSLVEWKAE